MNKIKQLIKKIPLVKPILLCFYIIEKEYSVLKKIILFKNFFSDFKKYKKINKNKAFILTKNYLKPCIFDKTDITPVEHVYFFQDSWCAKKIFENKPSHHYDIGSNAYLIGIISQFTPTTMIDIRPIDLQLPGLSFTKGDILSLPFPDEKLESISSICVIEHIGLGRYGDRLDSFGSEKTIKEIKRVLAKNGNLYISLPVDNKNRIYFNAHKAFTRNYIMELFSNLRLMEEKYIYKKKMYEKYNKEKGFGTGLFHFKK